MYVCVSCSVVSDFAIPWTVAHQAPLSVEFSRQEYWRGLPCPSPEDLPNLGIKLGSSTSQADSLPSEPPGKPIYNICIFRKLWCICNVDRHLGCLSVLAVVNGVAVNIEVRVSFQLVFVVVF